MYGLAMLCMRMDKYEALCVTSLLCRGARQYVTNNDGRSMTDFRSLGEMAVMTDCSARRGDFGHFVSEEQLTGVFAGRNLETSTRRCRPSISFT